MRIAAVLCVALLVAGCAVRSAVPALEQEDAPAGRLSPHDYLTAGLSIASYFGNYIADYANHVKAIGRAEGHPSALAFSGKNQLWVANHDADSVTIYATDGKVLRTVTEGIHQPSAVAADASGNVYIANKGAVTVFAPDGETPIRSIVNRYGAITALHVGPAGTYVVEGTKAGKGPYHLLEYAAGGIRLVRTIEFQSLVRTLASDARDTLYVGDSKGVDVYPRGSTTPSETLAGTAAATALSTDGLGNLYVGDTHGKIAVFAAGAASPTREFRTYAAVVAMAWEPNSCCLYAATRSGVEVFALDGVRPWASVTAAGVTGIAASASGAFATLDPQAATFYSTLRPSEVLRITQGLKNPIAEVFDRAGYRYAINTKGPVTVYAPGEKTVLRSIGVSGALCGIVDAAGRLYIGSEKKVTEYDPGQTTPARTITDGIEHPKRLALDATGNLYVADLSKSRVTVYPPGSDKPIRTLATGIVRPYALAFDGAGNLYVGSLNNIQVYAGGAEPVVRRITDGVSTPLGFGFDAFGNLYAVNNGQVKSVTEYEANSTKLLRTITGFAFPQAVAVDESGIMFVADDNGSVNAYATATGKSIFSWGEYEPSYVAIPPVK